MVISTMLNHIQEASLGKSKQDRYIRYNHSVHISSKYMLPIAFRHCVSVL